MNRRLLRNIAIGLALLIVCAITAVVLIVPTDSFRNYVREKIIAAAEQGTGGNVELGSFRFDLRDLHAVITDFVIHGHEPAGAAPFVRVRKVEMKFRLFTNLHHLLDVSYLGVEQPQVNIIVASDGTSNIPTPKEKSTSNQTTLEKVVDVAVGHFELSNGMVTMNSQQQPLDLRAENLRAQFGFNMVKQGYEGTVALQPLYVATGRNTPVRFTITLPVLLQRDRVELHEAKITTDASQLVIRGSIDNMRDPKLAAHANGHLALVDLQKLASVPVTPRSGSPSMLDIDANATISGDTIQITGLRAGMGESNIEASGTLKDPNGKGELQVRSRLALGELGRLAGIANRPDGTLTLNGNLNLDRNNAYRFSGNVEAKSVAFTSGGKRVSGINATSAVRLDPDRLNLEGLRLGAFGGQFDGNVTVEEFARVSLKGDLRRLDLRTAARTFGLDNFAYDGTVAGPVEARADLHAKDTNGVAANARLTISPGKHGIPISGRLYANFNGASNDLRVDNSFIALPHTRLNISGSVQDRLEFTLETRDPRDLFASGLTSGAPPIALVNSQAVLSGFITGALNSPHVQAHLVAGPFFVQGRQFDSLLLDASASSSGVSVSSGLLTRGPMRTRLAASVGMQNWKPSANQPVSINTSIMDGDLADVMALAGQPPAGYSGALDANIQINGTVGNPQGKGNLLVTEGIVSGEPFDRIEVAANLTDRLITIPSASLVSGAGRVNLSAEYQHPTGTVTSGHLHARVQSNQIDLAKLTNLDKQRSRLAGQVQLQADVTGDLADTSSASQQRFLLANINVDGSARNLLVNGENYGDSSISARTSGKKVSYGLSSNFAGSNTRVSGTTELTPEYPTSATLSTAGLPVEKVLALANRTDIPVKGNLSASARLEGTRSNPQGSIDLDLTNAVLHGEPVDRLRGSASYLADRIDIPQLEAVAGPSRIALTARFDHPAGTLDTGEVTFRVESSNVDLARIRNVQELRPGLGGKARLNASGAASIRPGGSRVLLRNLDADLDAIGITAQGRNFGDLTLTAKTDRSRVNFVADSNLGGASIHGQGDALLNGDYPVNARVAFRQMKWSGLQPLLQPRAQSPGFELALDGEATVNGPVANTQALRGSLQIARLQLTGMRPARASAEPIVIENDGPIAAVLDRGTVRVQSLHLKGPQTDINVSGSASLQGGILDVTTNAKVDLAVLERMSRDVVSSGTINLQATARGTTAQPILGGRLELLNASLNYGDFPNGISKANGIVQFNGNSASVRDLTAETGGGKLNISGFARMAETPRFGLRVNAVNVRLQPQQSLSVLADASLNIMGTAASSTASGNVTINRVTYAPVADFGKILSGVGAPVQSQVAPSEFLQNMKLDIRVRTASSMSVQASVAQDLEARADLRIRGSAATPGVLGTVTLTGGHLVFFGSTYQVSSGSVAFYNPIRIEPTLNISLKTQAKGVDVVLNVTGPIDNMTLSYTSDPPLRFEEIIGLLASGKVPTSDPTLLANQPSSPPQSLQQMGESALVSKAIADPVSSRLQRVFGVSKLKIDPAFTSGSELPQARLTLQQQVSDKLTFTYITAMNDPNSQIVRAEWSIDPRWSAIATRDQDGIFSISLFYKRQFR